MLQLNKLKTHVRINDSLNWDTPLQPGKKQGRCFKSCMPLYSPTRQYFQYQFLLRRLSVK